MKPTQITLLAALALPLTAGADKDATPLPAHLQAYDVKDAHRNLETDEGAAPWIAAELSRTESYFEALGPSDGKLEKRLDELSRIGGVSGPRAAKGRTFYVKRQGDQEQSILYVRDGSKERALIDPAKLDASGKVALDWYYPSPSGEILAYGLSRDGSEDSVLHLLRVKDGKALGDQIPNTRHSSVAWLPDDSGFYYTRYPEGDRYNRQVYFHELGADPADDVFVFGAASANLDKSDWINVSISEDGSRLFFSVSKGWSISEIWMQERDGGELRQIISSDLQSLFGNLRWKDGKILLLTNHQAPNYKLISIDPAKTDPASWEVVIPEGDSPLEGFVIAGDKLVVQRSVKAVSHLAIHEKDGKKIQEVKLPDVGSMGGMHAERKGTRFVFAFSSFLRPVSAFEYDVKSKRMKEIGGMPAPNLGNFEVKQIDYPSYDGTWVPMFLVHRKDLKLDGTNPTLLTGYGGFNVSLTPGFRSAAVYWVEQGGVYAVANLRGGAELGETWHEAGMLENKHQVFRDFEYAMRYLIREGYTRPQRLAITGGSNGGLLMGAMMTQAPELFQAAVGKVGLYDMIRYHLFPPAELWIPEYGSADNPEQAGYLYGYSPYHQVLPGVRYPAFFGMTAKSDTRVSWVHTAKFVAALQEATSGTAPILFHIEEQAGHGQGKGRSDRLKEDVMMYRFIESELGMEPKASKTKAATAR